MDKASIVINQQNTLTNSSTDITCIDGSVPIATNESQYSLKKVLEKTHIKDHCILKAQILGNELITLDGWNQGFNNIIIWNLQEAKELQRIQFPSSSKITDFKGLEEDQQFSLIITSDDKKIWLFTKKDKLFSEIGSYKIKARPRCLANLNYQLFIGTSTGEIVFTKLNVIRTFLNDPKEIIPEKKIAESIDPKNEINQVENLNMLDTVQQNHNQEEKKFEMEYSSSINVSTSYQKEISLHNRKVNCICVAYNRILLTISEDKNVVGYDFIEEKIMAKREQNSCIRSCHLSKDETLFLTGNTAGQIIIYQASSLDSTQIIEFNEYIYAITLLSWKNSSLICLATNKRKWLLYNLRTQSIIQSQCNYQDYVSQLLDLGSGSVFVGEGKNLFEIWQVAERFELIEGNS